MNDIHCHACGGFITDPERISHRLADVAFPPAAPKSATCQCRESVIFGPPVGYASVPGMKAAADLN
ncbi:MAG TPA: hypothetical protein VH163_11585 [Gemmatimonadales bacterium]|nr:hypothetical protein [Gemmatimonadales bacterium]